MKRVLSLVLALALVLGSIPAGFAADTQTAGEVLKGYGVLQGDENGNLNETQTIDRATMYTILIKLLGKDAEAKAYTVPSTFTDDNTNWAANYIAFAEKEGLTKGVGNGLFSPNGKVTLQQMATIMLRALGYEADYNTAIADATAQGLLKSVVESQNSGLVVKSDVYTSMLNTLNAPVKDSTVLLGNQLKIVGFNAGSALAVSTVTAASAKTFSVKFNRAVTDADKVTFAVKRSTTAMTVTTTWNADKTEATLTSAANLPAATYTVSVLADAKEVSNKEIAITAQKLAKIEIVSDKLSVVTNAGSTIGYATYKAFDQYNNDVTSSYLTNNITWQSGVGTVDGSTTKGVLKLTPAAGQNLLIYTTVVVTGLDTTAGVTVTKSLATTTALGTLSDFKFGDASNVKLTDGDTTSVFYIPYTALDMSGNETKNYDLVRQGLLDTNSATASVTDITVSNNNITAKVVKDPANSKNAAIEVKVTASAANIIDLPVIITAMTLTGKVSTVNTTLAKAKQLDTFSLMAPVTNIASAEKVEIPFEAYDQAGNKVTKYSEINGKITLTPAGSPTVVGLYLTEKVDGSAKLMFKAPTITGTQSTSTYVTAVVAASTTGKMSSLSLTTQEAVKPTEVQLDAASLVTAMEHGAIQSLDFGDDADSTIVILDQYGRDADFKYTAFPTYDVRVSVTGNLTIVGSTDLATNAGYATLDANTADNAKINASALAGGSGTLLVELVDNKGTVATADDTVVDAQTVALSVVKSTDIVDYTMNEVTKTAYTAAPNGTAFGTLTAQQKDYALTLKVFGKTSGGSKVLLAGTPVVSASVDNNNDFIAYVGATTENAYDNAKVIALKPADVAKTGATTKATVTILHNAKISNVSSAVTSSTVAPLAVTPKVVTTNYQGVRVDGDIVYFDISVQALTSSLIQRYAADGTTTGRNAKFYFSISDSYGETGMRFSNFRVTAQTGTSNVAIDAAGNLTVTTFNLGDTVTISAITNNGLVKTVQIVAE